MILQSLCNFYSNFKHFNTDKVHNWKSDFMLQFLNKIGYFLNYFKTFENKYFLSDYIKTKHFINLFINLLNKCKVTGYSVVWYVFNYDFNSLIKFEINCKFMKPWGEKNKTNSTSIKDTVSSAKIQFP